MLYHCHFSNLRAGASCYHEVCHHAAVAVAAQRCQKLKQDFLLATGDWKEKKNQAMPTTQ
jgi:hypothetical protein